MKIAPIILLSLAFFSAIAQSDKQRTAIYNTNTHNVVNDGYDPVSYFLGKPLKGKSELSFEYKGVIYWFAKDENRRTFIENPIGYEPQYGGWCAYALGLKPQKVKVDPETYKMVNGKLYLFYNFGFTNTLKFWNKEESNLLIMAGKNWDQLIK